MAHQNFIPLIRSLSVFRFYIYSSQWLFIGSDPRPSIPVILLDDFIHYTIGRRPLERRAEKEDVHKDEAEGEAAEETSIIRMIPWFDQ